MAEEQQRWWYIFISSDRNFSFGKKSTSQQQKTSKSDLHYQLSCFYNNHKNERITTKTNNLKVFSFFPHSRVEASRQHHIYLVVWCFWQNQVERMWEGDERMGRLYCCVALQLMPKLLLPAYSSRIYGNCGAAWQ